MMLTRDDLAALATPVFGPEWQSALARERGVAVRTTQRWAKEGIARPETADAIRAYLLTRRIFSLPSPEPDLSDAERDDQAHTVMTTLLHRLLEAGTAVGWHPAELLAGALAGVVDAMVEGAGAPATVETLRDAMAQTKASAAL